MHESTPLTQFTDLGLAEPILRAVSAEGYTTPTPIQAAAIPVVLSGRDLVGIAQTGTGKTAAFVLPILDALARDRRRAEPKGCRALVLAPTRELAAQIADAVKTYGRNLRPSVAVIVGGVRPGPQIKAMAMGVDIVIATPGRLEDHMRGNAIRLERTGVAVLDEADQMLDLGFIPAIRRILARMKPDRQTMLFSATMPPPIRALANEFLRDPAEVAVTVVSRPIERIEQSVVLVEAAAKRNALVDLLDGPDVDRAIVFTRTKHGADKVCLHLEKAGVTAAAIHGNKSQPQRERALAAFKDGRVRVMVATDIAARGIDIDDVSHVINFELPNVPESYVHRIGRTARAGRSGIAISLCDQSERPLLRDIERLIGRILPGSPTTSLTGREPQQARAKGRPSHGGNGQGRNNGNGGRDNAGRPGGQQQRPRFGKGQPPRGEVAAAGQPQQGERKPQHAERKPGAEDFRAGLGRMLGEARPAGTKAPGRWRGRNRKPGAAVAR